MKPFACLLLLVSLAVAEEKPLAGAIIVVDAGHGGQSYSKSYTGGTQGVNSKITESEINLKVALELAKLLEEAGATVHRTRIADHRLSREGSSSREELQTRVEHFEHHGCHFWISVHHNSVESPKATGHLTIYKHNADNDKLYEAVARNVNDALANKVPGPKRALIKNDYHLTRETKIPGTICEAGFLTNPDYDKLVNTPGYPKQEAEAIAAGLKNYWKAHQAELVTLREQLMAERAKAPRDPRAFSSTALNPEFQETMKILMQAAEPGGKYDPAKAADYLLLLRKLRNIPGDDLKAAYDGKVIKLSGTVTDRKLHDEYLDLLVAMKLYAIQNEVKVPKAKAAVEKP